MRDKLRALIQRILAVPDSRENDERFIVLINERLVVDRNVIALVDRLDALRQDFDKQALVVGYLRAKLKFYEDDCASLAHSREKFKRNYAVHS